MNNQWGYGVGLKGSRPPKREVYIVGSSDGSPGPEVFWSIWDNLDMAYQEAEEVGGYVITHELNTPGRMKTWD